jgi:hypothetical protein
MYKYFRKSKLPNITVQMCITDGILVPVASEYEVFLCFVLIPVLQLDGNAPELVMQQH